MGYALDMKIRFAAFKGISWVSRLIRFWTRDEYSHVAYVDDLDKDVLIEAWRFKDGFRWGWSSLNANHRPGTPVEIWELEVEDDQATAVRGFLRGLADEKVGYDWKGFFGFVFKTEDWKEKYFCSEGCAKALTIAGVWPEDLKTYLVHPGYFVQLMKVCGFSKVLEFTI